MFAVRPVVFRAPRRARCARISSSFWWRPARWTRWRLSSRSSIDRRNRWRASRAPSSRDFVSSRRSSTRARPTRGANSRIRRRARRRRAASSESPSCTPRPRPRPRRRTANLPPGVSSPRSRRRRWRVFPRFSRPSCCTRRLNFARPCCRIPGTRRERCRRISFPWRPPCSACSTRRRGSGPRRRSAR